MQLLEIQQEILVLLSLMFQKEGINNMQPVILYMDVTNIRSLFLFHILSKPYSY